MYNKKMTLKQNIVYGGSAFLFVNAVFWGTLVIVSLIEKLLF